MSLAPSSPSTMLGLVADEQMRSRRKSAAPKRRRMLRTVVRRFMAALALTIGLSGFTMGTAQAFLFDDLKDNMASTIVNICGPNDAPTPKTYHSLDTLAGLNGDPGDGMRATVKPNWKGADPGQGGDARAMLGKVYGDQADVIKPSYERYGFQPMQWNQYGYSCFSPTLLMGPASNIALYGMVHVPMMIGMSVLNFAMDNVLYTGFAAMMNPFISQMYNILNPWIYFIVPIGVGLAWVGSKGSLQATVKAGAWGVLMLSLFLLMGNSTSRIVTFATNIVTEVAGTAACGMSAAAEGEGGATDEKDCDPNDPLKSVNEALWYGVPYQTWLVGQIGETEAAADRSADENDGQVSWGAAILNANYLGTEVTGEGYERGGDIDMSGVESIDADGKEVMKATQAWNGLPYTEDGKVGAWGEHDAWADIPALANVKIMCNDKDTTSDDSSGSDPSEGQRWMFSGSANAVAEDGSSLYCDSEGAGTTEMVSAYTGDEYNHQFLMALSGMVGTGAVVLTIAGAAIYLAFQKMTFFFLLFFAPVVLTIAAMGDQKRRPFAVRYAELMGANLLKQVAAVCIVLFVSYAMASLFGSTAFEAIPWVTRPFVAALFFISLVMMAFPMKNLLKGAVKGDTSALDKLADAPANALKTGGKVAAVTTAAIATGGVSAAVGGGAAAAGGKAAMLGKGGTMLGQAGRVMGIGSKTGRAMRASGALMKTGQGIMDSKATNQGRQAGLAQSAKALMDGPGGEKYRDQKTGKLLPNAQKMAMKDAKKVAEDGQKSSRATKAQDEHMAQFFQGWKTRNGGQHHWDDPESPENRRQAQAKFESERRQAKDDVDATQAQSKNPQSGQKDPQPQPTPGQKDPKPGDQQGGMHHGGTQDPNGGDLNENTQPVDFNAAREQFREKARGNLGGPKFAQEMDYNVSKVASGEEVLRKNGLTKDDVLKDPTTLLRGDAYEGGATTKMDPFHPASAAMNELRFAAASGDEDAMEAAVAKSVDAVNEHGVPDQISGVNSIGERAGRFQSIEVLGAMPSVTQDTTMGERAEAAQTMMAAQVAMPEGYQSREAVQDYTAALANPAVDPTSLEAMKVNAMEQLSVDMDRESGTSGGGMDPAMAGAFFAGAGASQFMGDGGGQQEPVRDYYAGEGPPPPPNMDQEPVRDYQGNEAPPQQQAYQGDYQEPVRDYQGNEAPPQQQAYQGDYQEPVREQHSGEAPAQQPGEYQQPAPQGDYTQPVQHAEPAGPGPVPADHAEPSRPADQSTGGHGESGESYAAPGEVTYTGPSNVHYSGEVNPVQQPMGGFFEAGQAGADERPAASEPSAQGNEGVSRDELRQAVSDGLRETQQERSFTEAPAHQEAPAHYEAPASADFASADYSSEAPTTPSVPTAGSVPPSGQEPSSRPFRSAGNSGGNPEGTSPVEPVEEDNEGAIIFRPPTKRAKDDSEEDDA